MRVMSRWVLVAVIGIQAHFAASYIAPLDEQSRRAFVGLLKWAWPWSVGDSGPLGRITPSGIPTSGFFLAVTAAGILVLAALAVAGLWVPAVWWRVLAATGAALSLVLMVSFFGITKLLPIAGAVVILAAALNYWTPVDTS